MGDCGSLLLGYLLAVFSVLLVKGGQGHISTTVPLLILFVPIVDTLVVMFRRWRSGTGLFTADRFHLHYRLMDLKIGHRQVVLLVHGVCYLYGLAAVICYRQPDCWLMSGMIISGLLSYLLLGRVRFPWLAEGRRADTAKKRSLWSL